VALAAGGVLGFAYGYLVAFRPFSGLLTPFFAVLFGSLLGMGASALLRGFRVRNLWVTRAIAFTVATVALYVSWAAWITAVVRSLGMDASFLDFLLEPTRLWDAVLAASRAGHWRFFDFRPTGTPLWLMWGFEAVIVYAAAIVMTESQINERGFCEGCGTWTHGHTDFARLPASDPAEFRKRLAEHDLGYLAALGDLPAGAASWTALDLHSCRCGSLNLLDAWAVTRRGKRAESRRPIFERLILKTEEARALKALAARQAQQSVQAAAAPNDTVQK
jgi:hypothetical protein